MIAKTLREISGDAITLHALAQALTIVLDEIEPDPSPASNAATVLADELVERAEQLRSAIDAAEV